MSSLSAPLTLCDKFVPSQAWDMIPSNTNFMLLRVVPPEEHPYQNLATLKQTIHELFHKRQIDLGNIAEISELDDLLYTLHIHDYLYALFFASLKSKNFTR